MLTNQHRVKILELLKENGLAKIMTFSKIINVSEVTIRQDLEKLEKVGYMQFEHVGA